MWGVALSVPVSAEQARVLSDSERDSHRLARTKCSRAGGGQQDAYQSCVIIALRPLDQATIGSRSHYEKRVGRAKKKEHAAPGLSALYHCNMADERKLIPGVRRVVILNVT